MGQYVDAEVKSAIGRADVVVRLADAVYVFEFKYDGTPDEALAQIDSKQYAIPYQADGRRIVKIGVNFDSATRTIGEWKIVEWRVWIDIPIKRYYMKFNGKYKDKFVTGLEK